MLKGLKKVVLILLLVSTHAFANSSIYTGWFSKTAVGGFDAVAYFVEKKAIKGNPSFQYEYLGVEWYFSKQEYLAKFKKSPEKYMPQYGGFCAWAVAVKKQRAPGDPKYWHIHDDKLYLNYDSKTQGDWLNDKEAFIQTADQHWPEMQ